MKNTKIEFIEQHFGVHSAKYFAESFLLEISILMTMKKRSPDNNVLRVSIAINSDRNSEVIEPYGK